MSSEMKLSDWKKVYTLAIEDKELLFYERQKEIITELEKLELED